MTKVFHSSLLFVTSITIMTLVGAFNDLSPCLFRGSAFRIASKTNAIRRVNAAPTFVAQMGEREFSGATEKGVQRLPLSTFARNKAGTVLTIRTLSMQSETHIDEDEHNNVSEKVLQIAGLAKSQHGSNNIEDARKHFNISYQTPETAKGSSCGHIVVVGRRDDLPQIFVDGSKFVIDFLEDESMQDQVRKILKTMVMTNDFSNASSGGELMSSYASCDNPKVSSSVKVSMCILPDTVSRNNHPLSPHAMTDLLRRAIGSNVGAGDTHVCVFGVEESKSKIAARPGAVASAIAKALPIYSQKQRNKSTNEDAKDTDVSTLYVTMLNKKGSNVVNIDSQSASDIELSLAGKCKVINDAVQMTSYLVDMPPNELTTDAYSEICRSLTDELSAELRFKEAGDITFKEIKGSDLRDRGYGGIYNVGKAAETPPRLIEMTYLPSKRNEAATEGVTALVGKGITFDTGGLSLKSKEGMPGMKHDMGGSAGVLGAFVAAVRLLYDKPLTLIMCLAENAIGPNNAMRNDDIIHMYSGKTVEINNSDAEGRLVLGDGVAHATKHIQNLQLVIDMATLTGAQLIATGKTHAGILTNSAELEQRTVEAGLVSGDLCFPLLYAPDLLQKEFSSKVADMKNSVKDRSNAQSSCAGHFIESHLHDDYKSQQKQWLHVDMAGPASKDDRGTGYGVGLVLALLEML